MEILRPNPGPGRLRHAVFDFDGTLSLARAGWQQVMADLMVEVLQATSSAETDAQLRARTATPILGFAGQPTLVQMQWLADEVHSHGGIPLDAETYKREYLSRLQARVHHLADLKAGRVRPEELRVPGALEFLTELHSRGVTCYIASGTDEAAVVEEAAAIGLAPLVTGIRGARADGLDPKRVLIRGLASRQRLSAGELAAFGDGRAEMEHARAAGGLAIGVASNESALGGLNSAKRELLIAAGADVIVADFARPRPLLAYLWPDE